jgi:saccharopine dehydrogenase-like NADP-dependent oxidoreductase
MLPYLFHPVAAKSAMKHKKHFFTTTYATDAMRELDQVAKENNLIIINEWQILNIMRN